MLNLSPETLSHLSDFTSNHILFIGYVDPGIGYVFQGLGPILPVIVGAVVGFFALFWSKIKFFFSKIFSRQKPTSSKDKNSNSNSKK